MSGTGLGSILDSQTPDEQPQEENVVQETQEEVLSNTETQEKTIEEPEVVEDKQPEVDFFALASERLGREIKSDEDLITIKEVEKEVVKPLDYLSEDAKAFDEYYRETGRPLKDYLNLKRDVNAMSKDEVIKETLKAEYPELSQAQINRVFNKKYGADPDLLTEEEIEDANILKEMDYSKAKKKFVEDQQKFLIPNDNSIASQEAKALERQAQAEEGAKLWRESVEQTAPKSIEINLGDDFKFTHNISEENQRAVKEVASDGTLAKYAQTYQDENGNYDTAKWQKDMYILKNFDKIINEVREHERSLTIEGKAKEDKNIDFSRTQKVPSEPRKLSPENELRNTFWSNKKKR